MKNKYDLEFIVSLFSTHPTFKTVYIREINKLFEVEFTKRNRWGESNGLMCVLTEDGKRHPYNNINTHSNVLYFFCKWFLKENEFLFDNLGNVKYTEIHVKQIIDFLRNNFDKFFTENDSIEYSSILLKLNKSWNSGIISQIGLVVCLYELFPESTCEFMYDRGDIDDMKGKDMSFIFNGHELTFQTKSGSWVYKDGKYYLRGSQNNLGYNEDRYGYVDITDFDTSILIFKNDRKTLLRYRADDIVVPEILVKIKPYNTENKFPSLLKRFAKLCYDELILLDIKSGENGDIIFEDDKKTITLYVPDLKDKNKINELSNKLEKELKFCNCIEKLT